MAAVPTDKVGDAAVRPTSNASESVQFETDHALALSLATDGRTGEEVQCEEVQCEEDHALALALATGGGGGLPPTGGGGSSDAAATGREWYEAAVPEILGGPVGRYGALTELVEGSEEYEIATRALGDVSLTDAKTGAVQTVSSFDWMGTRMGSIWKVENRLLEKMADTYRALLERSSLNLIGIHSPCSKGDLLDIVERGFNRTRHDIITDLGMGNYFTTDIKKALTTCELQKPDIAGARYIIAARVCGGIPAPGVKGSLSAPEGYDSAVDNVMDPTTVVTFNDAAADPLYVYQVFAGEPPPQYRSEGETEGDRILREYNLSAPHPARVVFPQGVGGVASFRDRPVLPGFPQTVPPPVRENLGGGEDEEKSLAEPTTFSLNRIRDPCETSADAVPSLGEKIPEEAYQGGGEDEEKSLAEPTTFSLNRTRDPCERSADAVPDDGSDDSDAMSVNTVLEIAEQMIAAAAAEMTETRRKGVLKFIEYSDGLLADEENAEHFVWIHELVSRAISLV